MEPLQSPCKTFKEKYRQHAKHETTFIPRTSIFITMVSDLQVWGRLWAQGVGFFLWGVWGFGSAQGLSSSGLGFGAFGLRGWGFGGSGALGRLWGLRAGAWVGVGVWGLKVGV